MTRKKGITTIGDIRAPGDHEAIVYKFTNLTNSKKYIGSHKVKKGFLEDTYQHSSTNPEFLKDFADLNNEFTYEIVSYGTLKTMRNLEHELLVEVDARNNDDYYNRSNAETGKSYKTIRFSKCRAFIAEIKAVAAGESDQFEIRWEPKSLHRGMGKVQVRYKEVPEHIKNITSEIDDAIARRETPKMNPLVILENRSSDNKDLRLDGSMTLNGALGSDLCVDVPAMYIPEDIASEYTMTELRYIAGVLNKRADVFKAPNDKSDGQKLIQDNYYEDGIEVDDPSNVQTLKDWGFTTREITSIFKKALHYISKKDALDKRGMLFVDWTVPENEKEMKARVDEWNSTNETVSLFMSSGKTSLDRIWHKIDTREEVKQVTVKNVVIVIHHPTEDYQKSWKSNTLVKWTRMFEKFMPNYKIHFDELDMWRPTGE